MSNDSFIHLVLSLQSSAWMFLGKIANPMTGKPEMNMEGAKETIDLLLMLKEKTVGNLSKSEEDLLDGALTQLQINYVEEVKKNSEKIEEKENESSEEKIVDKKEKQ